MIRLLAALAGTLVPVVAALVQPAARPILAQVAPTPTPAVQAVAVQAALDQLRGAPAASPAATLLARAWVQLGPGGGAIVRAVTTGEICPSVTVDGRSQPMQVRANPASGFPVLVCERALPAEATSAAVGGQALALPRPNPRRIVVVGDTGCRLNAEEQKFQACNDPAAWPAATIARSAAAWRPDLIIHVGDYLYRESPCPPAGLDCGGSPFGDVWAAWEADFFAPFAPLLTAAPWLFLRGNHENCARAGEGWFRLLDPRPAPAVCLSYTDPYAVSAGDLQFLVLDSANATATDPSPSDVAPYVPQFAALEGLAGANAWLVSHVPMWAFVEDGKAVLHAREPVMQHASQNRLPAGVRLVLSGHIHLFEALGFTGGRPPQLVVGNGGTLLDHAITQPVADQPVAGETVTSFKTFDRFGFVTIEPTGDGWSATVRDTLGGVLAVCGVHDARLTCDP